MQVEPYIKAHVTLHSYNHAYSIFLYLNHTLRETYLYLGSLTISLIAASHVALQGTFFSFNSFLNASLASSLVLYTISFTSGLSGLDSVAL